MKIYIPKLPSYKCVTRKLKSIYTCLLLQLSTTIIFHTRHDGKHYSFLLVARDWVSREENIIYAELTALPQPVVPTTKQILSVLPMWSPFENFTFLKREVLYYTGKL